MATTQTPTRSIRVESLDNSWNANVFANTPSQIKQVLLADGKWHRVSNCELTQYAIGESNSPVSPSKFYPYLSFMDVETKQTYRIPFSAVMGIMAD